MEERLRSVTELLRSDGKKLIVHSQKVFPGAVYVALPPAGDFSPDVLLRLLARLREAAALGASFLICDADLLAQIQEDLRSELGDKLLPVFSTRSALGRLARAVFRHEAAPRLIGITGTNGKTTCTYLLEHLFTHAGLRSGVLGTINYRWPGHVEEAFLTTPGCLDLHTRIRAMAEAGTDYAILELSSHALDQERAAGLDFSAALFTNLTQDHLDYHQDMEEYFAAKARLFKPFAQGGMPLDAKLLVINRDDPFGLRLLDAKNPMISYGLSPAPTGFSRSGISHLTGTILNHSLSGLRLRISYQERIWDLNSCLIGKHNALNLLGVQALALGLGIDPDTLASLASFPGVPGRLEYVAADQGVHYFVDYAHTPDALENALATLRQVAAGRIISVFGCGGGRDRTKRPLMGEAAARWSDVVLLTSDNPRFEDPEAIMADIRPGLRDALCVYEIPDRRQAIKKAVQLAQAGDLVLLAGRGHETVQVAQGIRYDFNDLAVIKEFL